MSEETWLEATRDHLRTTLHYSPNQCEVEFSDEYPPMAGDVFIAVCPGALSPDRSEGANILSEQVSIDVHVVMRAAMVPLDRMGEAFLLKNLTGLNARVRKVINAVHMNYTLMTAVNQHLTAPGYYHPLRWTGCGRPQVMDGSEFLAQSQQFAGVKRVVSFGGALRIQPSGDAE